MQNSTIQLLLTLISIAGGVISLVVGISIHKKLALQISSGFLIATCIIVIIGYVADAPAVYTFPPAKTSMALPTGICFGIVGMCIYVIANSMEFTVKSKKVKSN